MKRAIAALELPDVTPGAPPTPPPVFMMVRPTELLVEDSYQRDLSPTSLRLIRRMVEGWDWRRFKAPNVVMMPEGGVVIDGQHTAIGAACHPAIDEIPVLVVEAEEQRDRAKAFVGINTDRVGITAAQMFHANVAAGDPAALAVDRVCVAAGLKVLRLPPPRAVYKPGETIAVSALGALVRRRGEDGAITVLRILVELAYGPVTAAQILAVEELVFNDEFNTEMLPGEIGRVIATMGLDLAEKEAKAFAATHCIPLWRGLASTLFKNRKAARRRASDETRSAEFRDRVGKPIPVPPPSIFKDPPNLIDVGSEADSATRDTRPPHGAWAPGHHRRRCNACDGTFDGARMATICAECAYDEDMPR